ncbi:NUDIX domain-containing protein [Streptomyces sp. NPDC089915]|uniref:NUDIX domain-containing protein n=1 Tax=Streptomyces sp. NPDC089915 TaxID=3155186 RepID=UPI003443F65F
MTDRVRAALLTPASELLFIRRTRPGTDPYHVFIGGGIEPEDTDDRAALTREIREEIAGHGVTVQRLLHTDRTTDGTGEERFYLATLTGWDFDARRPGEFTHTDRGTYELTAVPATPTALSGINLMPPAAAHALITALKDRPA